MPIYEYQCQECGIVFEEMFKQFDVDEYPCPKCKEAVGLRLISRPSLQFKGTGWTYTDGMPNANWGKPSAAEDPYHNPGVSAPVKCTEETATPSATDETTPEKAS